MRTHSARNTHELHTELYLTHSDSRCGPNEHAAYSFARPMHQAHAPDIYRREWQKENVYMSISETGGNCWGRITARMCVSNKIPANYYYNDGFLEANWPPANFIHLANVPYSVVYIHTPARHAGACLSHYT